MAKITTRYADLTQNLIQNSFDRVIEPTDLKNQGFSFLVSMLNNGPGTAFNINISIECTSLERILIGGDDKNDFSDEKASGSLTLRSGESGDFRLDTRHRPSIGESTITISYLTQNLIEKKIAWKVKAKDQFELIR